MKLALSLSIVAMLISLPAEALEWRWSYQGDGVMASGAFTTKDAPNADGFYEITGIKGEMNGVAITGLQPAGTSIPGNEGYPVDNLLRVAAPAALLARLRLCARRRNVRQSLLRRAFRPAGYVTRFSPTPRTARRASRPSSSPRRSFLSVEICAHASASGFWGRQSVQFARRDRVARPNLLILRPSLLRKRGLASRIRRRRRTSWMCSRTCCVAPQAVNRRRRAAGFDAKQPAAKKNQTGRKRTRAAARPKA